MANLLKHAEHELKLLGGDDDGMQSVMNKHILEMVRVFGDEGHSGFSASYAVNLLEKLLRFEPLKPLTGEDDEWNDVSEHGGGVMKWQNKRCSHVFKDVDGRAYDIEGKIFREPDGSCYPGKGSSVDITFPYTPKREYVDRASA